MLAELSREPVCGIPHKAHHLRELDNIGVVWDQGWANEMIDLLLEARDAVEQAKSEGKDRLDASVLHSIRVRYGTLAPTVARYLAEVRCTLADSPCVFVNPRGNAERQFHGRVAPWSVEALVRQAGRGAGVGERHFPHRWRHTYATSLLRRGLDIYKVKRLLGHAKLATTERYLHLSDDDLADAVDLAFPEPL